MPHDGPSPNPAQILAQVGVVAIGRNEGERLKRCLRSISAGAAGLAAVVYVDSGSTDGSVEFAREQGAEVVELDMSVPFTAARARNAGFERLLGLHPELAYVQFVDGDCALASGWLETAAGALAAQPDVVAVWGRRRELHRDASVYNQLCDLEWGQAPVGETLVFGGDVLVRTAAVSAVGGYNAAIIAGEDPEFAVRLRRKTGGRILRLDAEMTLHDADMHRAAQWWKRAKRCGYAYAQVSAIHGAAPERFWVKERRRALAWGLGVPLAVPLLALPSLGASSLLLAAYPLRVLKIVQRLQAEGWAAEDARVWAVNCVAASVPEAVGIVKHALDRLQGRESRIIEYKRPA